MSFLKPSSFASYLTAHIPFFFALPYIVFSVPAILLMLYCSYQQFFSPLAGIPGPFWARFSPLWMIIHSWKGDINRVMIALHEKHGKFVRTGPNEVSTCDLQDFRTIYGAGSEFRKSDWYTVVQGSRAFDLLGERDEKVHAAHKRLVNKLFAMDTLKDLQPYVDKCIIYLMDKMKERQGEIVDLGEWAQLFAFDVIGEITFSQAFGFMAKGHDEEGTLELIKNVTSSAAWLGQVPWLYRIHQALRPYLGNHIGVSKRNGSMINFAGKQVAARKERGSDRKDILGKLVNVQKEKPALLDDAAVLSVSTSTVFAGSDTTASSIRGIIYELLTHAKCKAKLVAEIDECWKAGLMSDPVTEDQAKSLPYLQAVIYEGLRCWPAIGGALPRVVPPGGAEIAGRFLPGGTVIGTSAGVLHRDKSVWGEDAAEFNPDRWMVENKTELHRYFFTFSAGARTCMGRNIAWMELSKLIPTLFRTFDMQLVHPDRTLEEKSWFILFTKGLEVRMKVRNIEG